MIHRLHPICSDRPMLVRVIGCGGNGSQILTGLARLDHALRALGQEGLIVTAIDPDTVSPANVARQMFSPGDVGHHKAVVLINRINAWFGRDWIAEAREFRPDDGRTNLIISCVDSRAARRAIHHGITSVRPFRRNYAPTYWMDLGNRAEDGQVILGQPAATKRQRADRDRLPTVTELLPEIIKPGREDNTPSCSLAEALERQHLFVNQAVATAALQILWQLLRTGQIDWHGAFINLRTGRTNPVPVDREVWARMRTAIKKGK